MPQAKTIKQAKAAFKTRTEQPLTEREQKQLERSIQLDRRAWGIREREKNKADIAKKRVAQEKAQKDEERRLGTQRRFDKHGFKSSQFHLGAFFGMPHHVVRNPMPEVKADDATAGRVEHSDPGDGEKTTFLGENDISEFEDEYEDVDDESLLEALQSPELTRVSKMQGAPAAIDTSMPPPPRPKIVPPPPRHVGQGHGQAEADLEWCDFLESSTQIAREIDADVSTTTTTSPQAHRPAVKEAVRTTSFSSGSFDLTEDDIEQLDPTPRPETNNEHHEMQKQTKAVTERLSMPPPPLPPKRAQQRPVFGHEAQETNAKIIPRNTHADERLGFSMTQLESFMDDDLELTQT